MQLLYPRDVYCLYLRTNLSIVETTCSLKLCSFIIHSQPTVKRFVNIHSVLRYTLHVCGAGYEWMVL